MASFSAQVSDFTKRSKRAQQMVMRTAVQKLTAAVEDETPEDTGNAFRSWLGSTTAMPPVRPDVAEFVDTGATEVAIMGLDAGDTFWFGAQAAYMARLNYGFTGTDSLGRTYNQAGKGWIEANAARWPQYVKEAESMFRVK
jgi:hypothetical protein